MDKTIEDVLFEIVAVCENMNLEFAIMGGIAVRVHGIPRKKSAWLKTNSHPALRTTHYAPSTPHQARAQHPARKEVCLVLRTSCFVEERSKTSAWASLKNGASMKTNHALRTKH